MLNGLTHRAFFEQQFSRDITQGRLIVFEGDSATSMEACPDEFYDLIYIDADHLYAGVLRDATIATRKLKRDGTLIFNDYIMYDHLAGVPYGIVPVVNDLCVHCGWRITHFAFHQQLFCDVALQRVTS